MTQPPPTPSASRAPPEPESVPWGRFDLAMVALGLTANAFLALSMWPLLRQELVSDDLVVWWRTVGTMVVLVPLLVVAAWSAYKRTVRSQIIARAISWSNLIVGTLIAVTYPLPRDRLLGAGIAVGCAVALLALGNADLEHTRRGDPFAPVRFRGVLLLALTMAFADAQTLTLTGLLRLPLGGDPMALGEAFVDAAPVFGAAAVMAIAVWGLYRLSTWALLLNLLANIVIAWLALSGRLGVSVPVGVALASTALVQALLPMPILAVALGRRGPRVVEGGRLGVLIPAGIIAVGGFAIWSAVRSAERSGWHGGADEAFLRGLRREGVHGCPSAHREDSGMIPLRGLDLAGARLDGLCLIAADLRDADLRGARGRPIMHNADLRGADLREADLTGAELSGRFQQVDLRGAVLDHTRWAETDQRPHVSLRQARLDGASLYAADLSGVDLTGASLRGVDLQGADLRGAMLRDVDLTGADLRGAWLPQLPTQPVDISGSITWDDARCPDGTIAPVAGCAEHRASLPQELLRSDMITFELDSLDGWRCTARGQSRDSVRRDLLDTGPTSLQHYFGRHWERGRDGLYRGTRAGATVQVWSSPFGLGLVFAREDCGSIRVDPVQPR